MDIQKIKSIIEAILFAAGREVKINELVSAIEINKEEIINIISKMTLEYEEQKRAIEIIKVDDAYQMCTKKEYYEYIYPILDKRAKPNLSNAALETLSIIAYNPEITRAEIEAIRGVNSDASIYKLLEYNLIEEVGRLEAPGRPTIYKTTKEFLKMFGYSSLEELPDLPKYKIDENQQIVIDDILEENKDKNPEREEEADQKE
ncbi:MAG: SMC-Scp complex subunit ScpB [Clostridia bacterium]|jgi:segregation and condensation protein B|nr:SMC-Scp complex subunit ScpB [Clostridia bacterium]